MMMMPMFLCRMFCLVAAVGAVSVDYQWTVTLTVAEAQGSDYVGPLDITAVFETGLQHAVTLPVTRFENGQSYTFDLSLMENGDLSAVFLRTRAICPFGLMPLDVLRLSKLSLVSKSTDVTYEKRLRPIPVVDACQTDGLGTEITELTKEQQQQEQQPEQQQQQQQEQEQPLQREQPEQPEEPERQKTTGGGDCLLDDGRRIPDGQSFDMGCVARCRCDGGQFGCVDMCPTVSWEPEQDCRLVRVPGQCCERVVCAADPTTKTCQQPQAANVRDRDGQRVGLRRYPWAVFVCAGVNCTEVYGGVVVSSRHILAFVPEMFDVSEMRLSFGKYVVDTSERSEDGNRLSDIRVTSAEAHPDFVDADAPFANSAARLQLFTLDGELSIDQQLQPANLPFNGDHCERLSLDRCPTLTAGWDATDEDEKDQVRQWYLHADQTTVNGEGCPEVNDNAPTRRGQPRRCIGQLKRQDCTGPLGGAVLTSIGQVDFLVGLLDPDNALLSCQRPGTASALPVCSYIDWIVSKTSNA